jgi:hypothetical protein
VQGYDRIIDKVKEMGDFINSGYLKKIGDE